MPNIFETIGLIGKYGDPGAGDTLKSLSTYLQERGIRVLLDETTADMVPNHGLETGDRKAIGTQCDLAIVVGGDGSLLNAARSLVEFEVPLLGVNLGRLGFLVDISPANMTDNLDRILAGDYIEEKRSILHTTIQCEAGMTAEHTAFNDVVVHKWNVARMIELDIHINGEYVNTQRSDGLIAATPTGSTAYALSGGGPIVHPALDAFILVPICPHTMSHRPLVIEGSSQIEIFITQANHTDAQVTCDGQINLNLVPGDRIKVRRKDKRVRLIHPPSYDYYEILRAKLRWGEKLQR